MRYEAIRQDDPVLRERLKDLAKARRRFGYRRPHVFLRREPSLSPLAHGILGPVGPVGPPSS